MREFLRGCRRRTGCVTLMLALVFLAGWVRSELYEDNIVLGSDWSYSSIDSYRGGLNSYRSTRQLDIEGWYSHALDPNASGDPLRRYTNPHEIKWRWQCCGFDAGEMYFGRAEVGWCRIPYLGIVIPLTLLSAWLLLSKPGKSTPTKTTEPAAAAVAVAVAVAGA